MATGSVNPFSPQDHATQVIAATTTSQQVEIGECDAVLVYNSGTTLAFIRLVSANLGANDTAPAVVNEDLPLPAGVQMLLSANQIGAVAAIMSSSTANIYVTPGNGTQR